jgi:hypothetical protein
MPAPGGGGFTQSLGRISGPLLAANLRRDGQDLWFADTDLTTPLLYLDVNNGRIGINTDSPTRDLLVNTTTNLQDDLQVDTQLDIANLTFLGHTVSALTGNITISPNQSTDPEVITDRIGTANLRISDKLIENITLDSDINLTANGTGQVRFTTTTVNVDGNLHSTGNITFDGDVTLGSGADDNVEFKADVNSHIIPDDHNTWDLGSPTQRWNEIFVDNYYIGTTTVDNISVIQTLLSKGNTNFSGPSHQFGNDAGDLLEFNGSLLNSWIPNSPTLTVGSSLLRWDTGYFNELTVDGVTNIQNSAITTLTTDTDLQLLASGTGKVHVTTADVQIDNDLTVNTNTTINGITSLQNVEIVGTTTLTGKYEQTGDTYITGTFGNVNLLGVGPTSYLEVTSIKVDGSEVSATTTNSDLVFSGATTGGVILDAKLKVVDSTISNVWASPTTEAQKSIFLTPDGTGTVTINSTKSLVLPLGNSTTRNLTSVAELRYNTNSNLVEGYVPSGRFNLNNLYDGDRNTYITPELTPGVSDDTLRFGINGTVKATVTPTYFKTNTMHVDDVSISGTTISSITTSNDLTLLPTGTGVLDVNNVLFKDDSITNTTNGALIFSSTGTGYVKFMGSGAVAIPYGDDSTRPASAESGELRYSTEQGYLEVYDGLNWIPSSGTSLAASQSEVEEIMNLWAIILG